MAIDRLRFRVVLADTENLFTLHPLSIIAMSITNIGADAAEESNTNNGSESNEYDYERFDLSGCSFGKQHPTTAVRGEAVALRRLYDENDRDRADVAVIMDNPSLVTEDDALAGGVVVQSEEEGDQFKVVDTDDDETKVLEGMGIDFSGNTFYGDIEDGFGDMDRVALKRGGGAGRRITKTLGAAGGRAAEAEIERDEDGNITEMTLGDDGFPKHNGGYIEYDNDGDQMPRQARDPELRPDVEGREIVVMIQRLAEIDPDYNGNSYWATVFANLEDERAEEITEQYAENSDGKEPSDFTTDLGGTEFVRISPTPEFEPSSDLLEETGWIQWNTFDRDSAEEVLFLNEQRLEEGHGSVYIPEGQSEDDVVPDSVENLELNPGEDDWEDDAVTPAFGGGAGSDTEEAEA